MEWIGVEWIGVEWNGRTEVRGSQREDGTEQQTANSKQMLVYSISSTRWHGMHAAIQSLRIN